MRWVDCPSHPIMFTPDSRFAGRSRRIPGRDCLLAIPPARSYCRPHIAALCSFGMLKRTLVSPPRSLCPPIVHPVLVRVPSSSPPPPRTTSPHQARTIRLLGLLDCWYRRRWAATAPTLCHIIHSRAGMTLPHSLVLPMPPMCP